MLFRSEPEVAGAEPLARATAPERRLEAVATAEVGHAASASGPSSSGKTTFSKRLWVQLLANGVRPLPIGLDDYFVDRERTPRDSFGDYDFENPHALDLELINQHLSDRTHSRAANTNNMNPLLY